MRSFLSAAVLVSAVATPAFAEDGSFHNVLLESPSIVSPSQIYQVQPKGLVEASIGIQDGTIDPKAEGLENEDSKSTILAVGGAFVPAEDWVLNLDVRNEENKTGDNKFTGTEFRPTVAYTFNKIVTLGISQNFYQAKFKIPSLEFSKSYSASTTTIGATYHQNDCEATLAFSTKHEDKDGLNLPQELNAHARHRFNTALALGLSFEQKDYKGIASEGESAKAENRIGIHAETKVADNFGMEFAFLSTTNVGGEKSNDGSEFVILGAAEIAPRLEVGGRLSYATEAGDTEETTTLKPALFVSAGF